MTLPLVYPSNVCRAEVTNLELGKHALETQRNLARSVIEGERWTRTIGGSFADSCLTDLAISPIQRIFNRTLPL